MKNGNETGSKQKKKTNDTWHKMKILLSKWLCTVCKWQRKQQSPKCALCIIYSLYSLCSHFTYNGTMDGFLDFIWTISWWVSAEWMHFFLSSMPSWKKLLYFIHKHKSISCNRARAHNAHSICLQYNNCYTLNITIPYSWIINNKRLFHNSQYFE